MRIGVIGATGVFGRELTESLAEVADEGWTLEPPALLATERSAGEEMPWGADEDLAVETFVEATARGLDAAVVAVPAANAPAILALLRSLGVPAVDASGTGGPGLAMFSGPSSPVGDAGVVLPGVDALLVSRIVAPLLPLGALRAHVTLLKAASAFGHAGIRELAEGTGKLLNAQEPDAPVLPHRLAFNVIPQVGPFEGADTASEKALARDVVEVLGRKFPVASTIAWSPAFFGHFATVEVTFEAAPVVDAVRSALKAAPGVKLLDAPEELVYPMPSLSTGDDAALVGRVRASAADASGVQLVAAIDGVKAGTALAIQALRALHKRRLAS